jgi:glycerophosphoryl diester phosphodiesterase
MKFNYIFSLLLLTISGCATNQTAIESIPPRLTLNGAKPIVIGHRGASGYLPEHTLAAYEKAITQGADFIEPDLVATKDGFLVARHENEFSGTSDIAILFPDRRQTKEIDGEKISGWFTEDFTLAEIKKARARERLPFRPQLENGKHQIPTLEEIIALVEREQKKQKRSIGIYPELKHGAYFRSIGNPLEPRLLEVLSSVGYSPDKNKVLIQSFEPDSLRWIHARSKWQLVQLLLKNDPRFDPMSDETLKEISSYAQGIGPDKRMILAENFWGRLKSPNDLIERAHRLKLFVHPYTFRSDKEFLHSSYGGDPMKEYEAFYRLGVDGVFSDFPDHAVAAREKTFRTKTR